jgi:MFS transporter, OPA family, glycerol-3-phosphate transporter
VTHVIIGLTLLFVITLYFITNPLVHGRKFMWRRFTNWFPLAMTYAFLYMARYNLSVSKNALGDHMPVKDFGIIFGIGTIVYGCSFLINGPLVDRIGGKRGIIIAALGSCIANGLMGIVTYLFLHGKLQANLTIIFTLLYSMNMFFQSYGAVSIIKVKAYWFHVRERGTFGAIFGTFISVGAYFAFDWGQMIVEATKKTVTGELTPAMSFLRTMFAVDVGLTDATWLVFFIPSFILIVWALIDVLLIKDTPEQAGHGNFDPHDASSDDAGPQNLSTGYLLKKIFTNPIMLTISAIEFTSGVLRNGIMQWYFVFAKEIPQIGAEFFKANWGFAVCMSGIFGGFAAGIISDKVFHSRRGPPTALMCGIMFFATVAMSMYLFTSPMAVGWLCMVIIAAVIGVHSSMSGTAAADFGGRKNTATASGIVDGFVYLGSGLQSISIGYLVQDGGWKWWPMFLVPFTLMGLVFSMKMWHSLPEATRRYLKSVENVDILVKKKSKLRFGRKTT